MFRIELIALASLVAGALIALATTSLLSHLESLLP